MDEKTWNQSQVESYQRLKRLYLMPPFLTLSIIRYGSRVKSANPRKVVTPSLHFGVVAIEKGAFGSPSTTVANFTCILYYVYHGVMAIVAGNGHGDTSSNPGRD